MNLLGSFDRFKAICDDVSVIISLFIYPIGNRLMLVLNLQVGVMFAARWSNSVVYFMSGCRCPFAP